MHQMAADQNPAPAAIAFLHSLDPYRTLADTYRPRNFPPMGRGRQGLFRCVAALVLPAGLKAQAVNQALSHEVATSTPEPPAAPGPGSAEFTGLGQSIIDQIKRCYAPPPAEIDLSKVIVTLDVRLNADGSLVAPPDALGVSGIDNANRDYANKVVEAARRAIVACAPLHLPPKLYKGGWDHIQARFAPASSLAWSGAGPIPYPDDAAQRGEQGSVRVGYDINNLGLIDNCRVVWSSQSAALDDGVCPALRLRSESAASAGKHHHRASVGHTTTVHFILFDEPFSKTFLPIGQDDEIVLSEISPPKARRATPAILRGDPNPIYPDDYPRGSRVMGEQGMVVVGYRIGVDGLIAACRIIGSSGVKRLDAATCPILMARMKYRPATDETGKPVETLSVRKIVWRNPQYQVSNNPRSEF